MKEIYYLNRRFVHAKEANTDSTANVGILPQKFVPKSCFVVSKLQFSDLVGSVARSLFTTPQSTMCLSSYA